MKIYVYDVIGYEEPLLAELKETLDDEIELSHQSLSMDTIQKCEGFDAISVIGYSRVDQVVLDKLKEMGILHLSTRTIGYDHIDVAYANQIGIHVYNAYYQPNNVADFAVMLMLMMLRKAKISVCRALVNDFSLDGMQGREMRNMTVGVIGTGKIGFTVIKNLSGFGCKIVAYDPYPSEKVKEYAEYVSLDELYKQADIITLHTPLTKDNLHMINAQSIAKMKPGVILINTARGPLVDTKDLITALETERIGGAAIDTVEGENGIMHVHVGTRILDDSKRDLLYLKQFPNVIYTQHVGFYTAEACESMVRSGIEGPQKGFKGEKAVNEVTRF